MKALAEQGYTEKSFRDTIRYSLVAQKLYEAITKDIKVEEAEILEYYQQNQAQYGSPESREVRHILISEKDGDDVDFAKSKVEANRIYRELQGGGDFVALAKENSDDPSVKDNSGKLTIHARSDGARVRQGSLRAGAGGTFQAREDDLRLPRHRGAHPGEKGNHDAHRQGPRVHPHHAAPAEEDDLHDDVGRDLKDEYDGKVSYAAGFEPPRDPGRDPAEIDRPASPRAHRNPIARISIAQRADPSMWNPSRGLVGA